MSGKVAENRGQKGSGIRQDYPIADVEKPIADARKLSECYPTCPKDPSIADVEKISVHSLPDNLSGSPPIPSPTVAPDIVEVLCVRAVREVEGLRIINESQQKYIASLEEKDKATQDFIKSQKELTDEYKSALQTAKETNQKATEIIANREEKIGNLEKKIVTLEKAKCGLKCKFQWVLTGVGIGVMLL